MSASVESSPRISLRKVADGSTPVGRRISTFAPLLDRLLGIHAIDRFCRQHRLSGLTPVAFATRALAALEVEVDDGGGRLAKVLPREGPVIVAANHPHGGIEGLVMIRLLAALRPDLKVLVNSALRVFGELAPLSIYVNPLAPGDPANRQGLRACLRHLEQGGLLVMFPAGRTSFYQRELGVIADSPWNRSLARFARHAQAQVLPVRFTGRNSRLFYTLGSVWYRFRLLMLARELLNKAGARVQVHVGEAIDIAKLESLHDAELTAYLQVQSASLTAPVTPLAARPVAALAPARKAAAIEAELAALPPAQRLLEAHDCIVGVASARQVPELLGQVTRERERTYRREREGSGEPVDTDHFDARVDHLFCWHRGDRALVGAYRIARADLLAGQGGTYLEHMFAFEPAFLAGREAALELGRSFVVPEYQRSVQALDLLWRGIGRFLRLNPTYTTLYGTVSLSQRYDPVSIAMVCDGLIDAPQGVRARQPLGQSLPPEWHQFRRRHAVTPELLHRMIAAREPDRKGLPVLVRHYLGLNARFHAVGVDAQFAATPGLLLSVALADLPPIKRRRYLG